MHVVGSKRRVLLRARLGTALAIAAAVAALAGVACLYVRAELISPRSFADRTVAALDRAPVRRVVSRELVVRVVEGAAPDLLAARPLITSAVEAAVATPQFRGIVHALAGQAHRLLFDRAGNVVFSVADAGAVVISALRTLAPDVAAKVPPDVDAKLLDLRHQSFAVGTLRVADEVRALAAILPPVALALLAVALAVSPRRRRALIVCGLALAAGGLALFADLALLRHATMSSLFGSEQLSDGDVREAAAALWDAYVGDLSTWMLALAGAGALLAAVACGLLRPEATRAGLLRVRGLAWPPRSRAHRAAAGLLAMLVGALLLARPTLALDVLAVLAGVALLTTGLGELLAALGVQAPLGTPPLSRRGAVRALGPAVGSLIVLVGAPAIVLAARAPAPSRAPSVAAAGLTCNGYAQLCDRRLDQVVFAGTHNSMSASESPSWLIANQQRAIARQLDDGIRAFKISTHYGIGTSPGHVQTDIAAAGERVNRVSEKLTEQARAALQRLTGSLGFGARVKGARTRPQVWLCHTLCELGATSMASFLATVARFLRENPDQVLVFFDEDYVTERSLEEEFKRSGLFEHLAAFRAGQQLPTLGQMIRSQHNVAVFTQEPVSGRHPWDMYGFGSWIQDTPLGAVKPEQFTCEPARGAASNPLLMMNDWADVFPPRRSPNLPLLTRSFILARARQCERERHKLPNLILTDFYNSGDLIGAVRELNGLGSQQPAPIVPVGP